MSDVAQVEALRPGAGRFDEATCGLPGCGEPLYFELSYSRAVYLSDTVHDLRTPEGAHTSSWQVTCGGGHTVLLPPPTAEDSYEFGECKCEPTDPSEDAYCGHGDMARLRAVLGESDDRNAP